MKRLKLLSLVGITSMALPQAGWAAGHGGGGGGFGGGGFSGGGARSGGGASHFSGGVGGFHAPSPAFSSPRVGVGTRGGGVGFGMGRYSPYQSSPSSIVRTTIPSRSVNSPARIVSGNNQGRAATTANRPNNGVSPSDRR